MSYRYNKYQKCNVLYTLFTSLSILLGALTCGTPRTYSAARGLSTNQEANVEPTTSLPLSEPTSDEDPTSTLEETLPLSEGQPVPQAKPTSLTTSSNPTHSAATTTTITPTIPPPASGLTSSDSTNPEKNVYFGLIQELISWLQKQVDFIKEEQDNPSQSQLAWVEKYKYLYRECLNSDYTICSTDAWTQLNTFKEQIVAHSSHNGYIAYNVNSLITLSRVIYSAAVEALLQYKAKWTWGYFPWSSVENNATAWINAADNLVKKANDCLKKIKKDEAIEERPWEKETVKIKDLIAALIGPEIFHYNYNHDTQKWECQEFKLAAEEVQGVKAAELARAARTARTARTAQEKLVKEALEALSKKIESVEKLKNNNIKALNSKCQDLSTALKRQVALVQKLDPNSPLSRKDFLDRYKDYQYKWTFMCLQYFDLTYDTEVKTQLETLKKKIRSANQYNTYKVEVEEFITSVDDTYNASIKVLQEYEKFLYIRVIS